MYLRGRLLVIVALVAGALAGAGSAADEVGAVDSSGLTPWTGMGSASGWNRGQPWAEEELHIFGLAEVNSITKANPLRLKIVVTSPQLDRARVTADAICWPKGTQITEIYNISGGEPDSPGTAVEVALPATLRVSRDWLEGHRFNRCSVFASATAVDPGNEFGKIVVKVKAKYAQSGAAGS